MVSIAFSPIYAHPLPAGHRFPMLKYELLPEQQLREGTASTANFFLPAPPPDADILRTHDEDYYARLRHGQLSRQEERATGFPWSAQLIEREVTILGGTIACARRALQQGCALNIAGGTHHSFRDRGEGFCLLNDQAAAADYLLAQGMARRILIVDLDVHQGNGTARIFQQEPRVFTFSMHGARNYPARKELSDLDLPLADGTDDATYLKLLADTLPRLLEQQVQPDFVFYLAGVDVLATDKLGHLGLTREGCRRRDEFVLSLCHQHQLPVVVCMGGGYSERIIDIVEAHANTFRVAAALWD